MPNLQLEAFGILYYRYVYSSVNLHSASHLFCTITSVPAFKGLTIPQLSLIHTHTLVSNCHHSASGSVLVLYSNARHRNSCRSREWQVWNWWNIMPTVKALELCSGSILISVVPTYLKNCGKSSQAGGRDRKPLSAPHSPVTPPGCAKLEWPLLYSFTAIILSSHRQLYANWRKRPCADPMAAHRWYKTTQLPSRTEPDTIYGQKMHRSRCLFLSW